MRGAGGSDEVYGGPGADNLHGNADTNDMYGGSGNDSVYSSSTSVSIDKLSGGSGDDLLYGDDGDTDYVSCGYGYDQADIDASDRVSRDCDVTYYVPCSGRLIWVTAGS